MSTYTQQEKRLETAMARLTLFHPFFGSLALGMGCRITEDVPTASTNGSRISYNPEFMDSLTDSQLLGLIVHEVMHVALGHPWRVDKSRHIPRYANMAMDYEINLHIQAYTDERISGCGIELPPNPLLKAEHAEKPWEKIYADENFPECSADFEQGDEEDKEQWGQVESAPTGPREKTQAQAIMEVVRAMHVARMQGALPGGFAQLLGKLTQPEISWSEALQDYVDELAREDWTMRRPDRQAMSRGLILPTLESPSMGEMVVAIDSSGSIASCPELVGLFFSEFAALLDRCQPKQVHLVHCDAAIHLVEEYVPGDTVNPRTVGGGDTDFRPVFDWVQKEGITPKVLVYFTDGYGEFPEADPTREYPVLWVSYEAKRDHYPWGDVIEIQA